MVDATNMANVDAPSLVVRATKWHGRQLIDTSKGCSFVGSEELAPA